VTGAILEMKMWMHDWFDGVLEKLETQRIARNRLAASLVTNDFFATLNSKGWTIETCPITPAHLSELVDLQIDGTVSGRLAKEVYEIMVETLQFPSQIVEERGLKQLVDTDAISAVISSVIETNTDKVAQYRSGKDKLLGFFVGQVMKQTQGKANPAIVNELLSTMLKV
jgi:aspartyl-tRNA(Asn)/glutamyl-tRNA(Gln) amidotransferase subunit B